jgi:hypothetical protein
MSCGLRSVRLGLEMLMSGPSRDRVWASQSTATCGGWPALAALSALQPVEAAQRINLAQIRRARATPSTVSIWLSLGSAVAPRRGLGFGPRPIWNRSLDQAGPGGGPAARRAFDSGRDPVARHDAPECPSRALFQDGEVPAVRVALAALVTRGLAEDPPPSPAGRSRRTRGLVRQELLSCGAGSNHHRTGRQVVDAARRGGPRGRRSGSAGLESSPGPTQTSARPISCWLGPCCMLGRRVPTL